MTIRPTHRDVITHDNGARPIKVIAASEPLGPYALNMGEMNVLFLIVEGEYPNQIAEELKLTRAEVYERLLSIKTKMEARSVTEAAVKAIRERIFASPRARGSF